MYVNSTKHGLQVGRLLATLRVWSTKTDCLKYRSREKKKVYYQRDEHLPFVGKGTNHRLQVRRKRLLKN